MDRLAGTFHEIDEKQVAPVLGLDAYVSNAKLTTHRAQLTSMSSCVAPGTRFEAAAKLVRFLLRGERRRAGRSSEKNWSAPGLVSRKNKRLDRRKGQHHWNSSRNRNIDSCRHDWLDCTRDNSKIRLRALTERAFPQTSWSLLYISQNPHSAA